MKGLHWGLQTLECKPVDALLSICEVIGYPDGCNLRLGGANNDAEIEGLALAADHSFGHKILRVTLMLWDTNVP